MSKPMVAKALIALSLLLASNATLSQENRPSFRVTSSRDEALELVKKAIVPSGAKRIVRAEENIYLVTEPPKGWLKLPGERRGVVRHGEMVAVLEEITVANLFASQRWLKVRRFCHAGVECNESTGWVYDGEADKLPFGAQADKAIFHDVQDPELIIAVRTNRQLRRYVQDAAGVELATELFRSLEGGR